jgi:hypothetical protein
MLNGHRSLGWFGGVFSIPNAQHKALKILDQTREKKRGSERRRGIKRIAKSV